MATDTRAYMCIHMYTYGARRHTTLSYMTSHAVFVTLVQTDDQNGTHQRAQYTEWRAITGRDQPQRASQVAELGEGRTHSKAARNRGKPPDRPHNDKQHLATAEAEAQPDPK